MTTALIVPFYNASETLLQYFLEHVETVLCAKKIENLKIYLVNDGSTLKNYEKTIEVLNKKHPEHFFFVSYEQNKGKGGAIKEGMKCATDADFAIFYDIDFPFGTEVLYEINEKITTEKADVILARRDFSYFKKLPFKRKMMSLLTKILAYSLSKGKIKDSQAGLKAMKKNIIPLLLSTESNSFMMDFEFLLKVSKQNYIIDEMVVCPNADIEFTNFSNQVIRTEVKSLIRIIKTFTK